MQMDESCLAGSKWSALGLLRVSAATTSNNWQQIEEATASS